MQHTLLSRLLVHRALDKPWSEGVHHCMLAEHNYCTAVIAVVQQGQHCCVTLLSAGCWGAMYKGLAFVLYTTSVVGVA